MTTSLPRSSLFDPRLLVAAALACALAGCFELDAKIEVHPDGSGTVTERFVLSQQLLDLDTGEDGGLRTAELLSKAAVEKRLKHMGEGIRLASHTVRDAPLGAKESVAVFRIDDLSKFRYASPFFGAFDGTVPDTTVACQLFPLYEGTWWGRRGGEMALDFKPVVKPPQRNAETPPPPKPTPLELQTLRNLQPVFRDMCRGLRIRVTVESFSPVRCRQRIRNDRAGTKTVELIDFDDEDLDRFGFDVLDNEEVMLDLLRGELASPNIVEHVKDYASNVPSPIFHPQGPGEIWFRPSRELFDRHFQGKQVTFYFEKGPQRTRPADFKEIGYLPAAAKPKE